MKKIIRMATIGFALITANVSAQKTKETIRKNKFGIVFGLTQPLILRGFNIEVNYLTKKMIFDYSHGFNLHVDGSSLSQDYESQKINFKIKHSFGFGIGYRFTKAFNLRFEPKIHMYETYYNGKEEIKSNSIVNFNTYTLGLGAYYYIVPFKRKDNVLKGITIVPSARYWQKIGTTLNDNSFSYFNTETKRTETFNAPNIGIANTPFFLNISIGYTF